MEEDQLQVLSCTPELCPNPILHTNMLIWIFQETAVLSSE